MKERNNILKVLILGCIYSTWTTHFVEKCLLQNKYEIWLLNTSRQVEYKKYISFYRRKNVHIINGADTSEKISSGRVNKKYFHVLYGYLKQLRTLIKYGKYDLIHLHYVSMPDLFYAIVLKYIFRAKIILSYWGSDLFRASDRELSFRGVFARCADFVTFDNRDLEIKFKREYSWADKVPSEVVLFGLSVLDIINKKLKCKPKESLRREWKIPEGKTVIAVGYNGIPEQQHLRILREIEKLDSRFKDKLFILLQMTYGGTKEYRKQIGRAARRTGCEYLEIKHFLTDEQVADLRIVTDVFINAQTTDAFSGSVCENLYTETILINAKWLRYQEFIDYNFKYLEFNDIGEIGQMIKRVLEEKFDVSRNKELVWGIRSWETCIPKWESVYHETLGFNESL